MKGDRNHGLRDEPMNLIPRDEDRKAAMPSSRSITSTSTVRHSGLSTSTMGSCGRDGQNAGDNGVRAKKSAINSRLFEHFR